MDQQEPNIQLTAQHVDFLNEHERLDYIVEDQLKIIQSPDVFSFSMDAILLGSFTKIPYQTKRIMDLCTGNGVIPLMLSQRTQAQIEGIELQEKVHDMASRSVQLNQKAHQITIHRGDVKEVPQTMLKESCELVTCNPPYMTIHSGQVHHNEHYALARHELTCTLADVVESAQYLLKPGGYFSMVHRPQRLVDIISTLRAGKLEPKRICFVQPKKNKPANIVLVEAVKQGSPECIVEPTIVAYDEQNHYTPELLAAYRGQWLRTK